MPTIEHADGFDGTTVITEEYTAVSSAAISAGNGRGSTASVRCTNWSNQFSRGVVAAATKWVMFARKTDYPDTIRQFVSFKDTAVLHGGLRMDSSGFLYFYRGTTQIAGPSANPVTENVWHHFAFGTLVADASGTLDVYVDNVLFLSFTGDTRNAGNATTNLITFGDGGSEGGAIDWDDLVIADTRYEDRRCLEYVPNGNGDSSQFTGSDGNSTDNYLLVDEIPPSGTDYVDGTTVGHKDLYNVTNPSLASGTVDAVVVKTVWLRSDAGARTGRAILKLSGTTANGSTVSPGTSAGTQEDVFMTKPGGGSWGTSDPDSIQIGTEVIS